MRSTYLKPILLLSLCVPLFVGCGDDDDTTGHDAGGGVDAAAPTSDASTTTPTIVGDWTLTGTPLVLRFWPPDEDGVGEQRLATSVEALDDISMVLGAGRYRLDGSRLTFTNTAGNCSTPEEHQVGIYDIELTATTLRFTVVDDPCPVRRTMDGVTITRL